MEGIMAVERGISGSKVGVGSRWWRQGGHLYCVAPILSP